MQQLDDLTLIKRLGKGSFGEVFLTTKKGRNIYYATKKIERKIADKPEIKKYFDNEIEILKQLNHPNIVQLEEIKKTNEHYFIVMEYINGGGLSDCLKQYMKKHNKAFPEEIVQYLMKQIIEALYYLHSRNIIHRDIKLDNIMVNFDTDYDKEILNMMRARIKLIDFGFATQLNKSNVTFSAVGSPINMDPIILNKFSKRKDINLGYDTKADIWSAGTICYELLIGKAVFNAKNMTDLANKVDDGNYYLPKSLSREVVSFLNGMLQYDSHRRLSAEQLLKKSFLTKNVNDFTKVGTKSLNKEKSKDISKNKPMLDFYDNADHLDKINRGNILTDAPIPEEANHNYNNKEKEKRKSAKSHKRHSDKILYNFNDIKHFNNQKININLNNNNVNNDSDKKMNRAQTYRYLPIAYSPTYGQNRSPQMGMPQIYMQQPMIVYPTYGIPIAYKYPGVYQNNQQQAKVNYTNTIQRPYSNNNLTNKYYPQNPQNNNKINNQDNDCSIQ
jgi:serine/threonine-protein kinase ULK/ATG1